MFTGLVQSIGVIRAVRPLKEAREVHIECRLSRPVLGESIAVHGTCLTLARVLKKGFRADLSPETLERTTFHAARPGDRVHIERSLKVGDPLGGHFVMGHVDGVGRIVEKRMLSSSMHVVFEIPRALECYLATKGSVAVDGVSLTINEVKGARFSVMLIPHTIHHTCLGELQRGARVNIEVDPIARYVVAALGRIRAIPTRRSPAR